MPLYLGGEYVASRGPLYIPPSEQGQPVVFHAGGSPDSFELAGRYASSLIGATLRSRMRVPNAPVCGRPPSARDAIPMESSSSPA